MGPDDIPLCAVCMIVNVAAQDFRGARDLMVC